LRQAYDYWQDQPGNYYPKRLERRLKAALLAPSRVFSLGWSSSTNPKSPSDSKGKAATVGLPSASGAYKRVPLSMVKPPCSSISQSSSALLPVLKETEIVAFGEDYQQPATPERHAAVAADPRVVI